MDLFFRTFKHLLPKARAWSLIVEKVLRQFFEGLTGLPSDVKDFIDEIFLDIFPEDTRQIDEWETQFGIIPHAILDADRRDAISAAWAKGGGQGPDTLQDVLRGAGFDVYVYDPWVPPSGPIRDPRVYVPATASLLVNKLPERYSTYVRAVSCGEIEAQCGEPASVCGDVDNYAVRFKEYTVSNDPNEWPYFWYIGDAVFGNIANVPLSRKDEFETLILKIGPAHAWAVLFINYV